MAIAIVLAACAPVAPHLSGTELDLALAPDFTLADGVTGSPVTLSSLRGNVVALAFLYTHCPDVCPLTAAQFRAAQSQLGQDASRVRFVAVSVDADGDTPSAVTAFSLAHDLRDNWHYLIGPRTALQPVWIALRANVRAVVENVTLAALAQNELPASVQRLAEDPEAWSRR